MGASPGASHKTVVEAYTEGFRRSDHEAILGRWGLLPT
jgi:hypothetical protein